MAAMPEASPTDRHVLAVGDIVLDVALRSLTRGGRAWRLTPKECRLLEMLLRHNGQVLTRRFLMQHVWQTDFIADTRTLEVHIHWLRQKLSPERAGPALIHTIRGVGYMFRWVEPEPATAPT